MTSHSTPTASTTVSNSNNSKDNIQEPTKGTEKVDTKKSKPAAQKSRRPGSGKPEPRAAEKLKKPTKKLPEDLRLAIVYAEDVSREMNEDTSRELQDRILVELDEHLRKNHQGLFGRVPLEGLFVSIV